MNTISKLILAIVIVLVLVGCGGRSAKSGIVQTKAEDVATAAAKIADFTLLDGYQADYAVNMAGVTVAAYNPGDGHSHLMLAQGPAGLVIDQPMLDGILDQAQPGRKDKTTRLTVIEQRDVTVRGQSARLVVSEGTNSEGQTYRQAAVPFQGKNGPALLVINEPADRWNTERIEAFINSIQ